MGRTRGGSANIRFVNILIIIMSSSEFIGVDAINLVQVDFTSDVYTADTLSRFSWSCCISANYSSVKSTITNGYMPLAAFTKAALFPIYVAVQSLFTIVFTKVGYIRTSA